MQHVKSNNSDTFLQFRHLATDHTLSYSSDTRYSIYLIILMDIMGLGLGVIVDHGGAVVFDRAGAAGLDRAGLVDRRMDFAAHCAARMWRLTESCKLEHFTK